MKIVDLSYKIINGMPVFPGDDGVAICQEKTLDRDFYNAISIKTGMHTGTHIDIPKHLLFDNRTIDEIPIDRFIGKGILLDVRGQKLISYKKEYEQMIKKNDIVLLYTGFEDLYANPDKYYNDYPVVDEDLADFLVSKDIKILGIDFPSPDTSPFNIHKKLLGNDIFIIENMTNLDKLMYLNNFEVYAVPLKIEAEASIVRAFAISRENIGKISHT